MKTIKTKHILIILAVGFFILVFVNEEKNTNPYSYTPSKSQSSYPSFDNVETYNSFQQKTHPN
ncbi:MAG: hypothetical protein KAS71_05160, partial [Bacteroidales bacterium]|nr:hypothetical protein [Bacteroidales bacterium]